MMSRKILFAFVVCLVFVAFAPTLAPAAQNYAGFNQGWMLLGPYVRDTAPNNPTAADMAMDYLRGGAVTETNLVPTIGGTVATDFATAASSSYMSRDVWLGGPTNGAPTPTIVHFSNNEHQTTVDTRYRTYVPPTGGNNNDGMVYAWAYANNKTGAPLSCFIGVSKDDCIQVLVNGVQVGINAATGGFGAQNNVQFAFPVTLQPGNNLVMLKVFNRGGGFGFRCRLQINDVVGDNRETTSTLPISQVEWGVRPGTPPEPVQSAKRTAPTTGFTPGTALPMSIAIKWAANSSPLTVIERLPTGWTASAISNGGTAAANVITWTLASFTADMTLTYNATPAASTNPFEIITGWTRDQYGITQVIRGDEAIRRTAAGKIVVYLRSDAATVVAYDTNCMNALGATGAAGVPGLGYTVAMVPQYSDLQNYTKAGADLILLSQTMGNANILYHGDDPLPIVCTVSGQAQSAMVPQNNIYFSTANTNADTAQTINIINNTHPITQGMALGNVVLSGGGNFGMLSGTIATGITVLAERPSDPAQKTLAVIEAGGVGLIPNRGPAGSYEPTPARRVYLGTALADANMSDANIRAAGVQLYQRCAQWAIGDIGPPPTLPAAPTGLTATVQGGNAVLLNWVDNANNEQGFKIERKTGAGTYAQIAQVSANTTTYTDSGLSAGTYSYRVCAFNAAGNSGYSNEVTVTVGAVVAPAAPSGLAGQSFKGNTVILTWVDNANNEQGFKIERKTGAGTFAEIVQVSADATSYNDSPVTAGTTYSYRVRAFNAAGNSAYSNEISVTVVQVLDVRHWQFYEK